MGRPRSWTDDQLRVAVAASGTFKEVHERLGLKHGGGTHSAVRLRIAELGLDTSHFEPRRRTATPQRPPGQHANPERRPHLERVDPAELAEAVTASASIREALDRLGTGVNGSTYAALKRAIQRHGIDASHFRGQGWARGTRGRTRNGGRPLREVLVRDSPATSTHDLRQRLLKAGLKPIAAKAVWARNGAAARSHFSSTTSTVIVATTDSRTCGCSVRTVTR